MRKIYGQSRKEDCYFCSKSATTINKQGISCCVNHKDKLVDDKLCACGLKMVVKKGKWGAFFLCQNCGPRSISKAEEMGVDGFKLNKKYRDPKH